MKLHSIIILMVPVVGMCLFIGKRPHVWDILFQNRATKFMVGGVDMSSDTYSLH